MRITPLDIRKQEFRRTMRGLDADEVYAFLGTVSEEYEAVLSDNKRLRETIVQLEERLTEFKSMETNLRNTLMTAERITAEAKENARREAELIVRGAEVEANKATEAIRAHTQQLRREILELKKHKDNYATRLRTLLESHMRVAEGFTEDFAEVDSEIEAIGREVEAEAKTAPPAPRMSRERITEDFAARQAAREESDKVKWGDERPREEIERPLVPGSEHRRQGTPGRPPTDSDPEQAPRTSHAPPRTEGELDFGSARPVEGARPDAQRKEGAGLPAGSREETGRIATEQAPGVAGQKTPAAAQDEWRSYEVKGERQDWSAYEVPRGAAAPAPPAAHTRPAAPAGTKTAPFEPQAAVQPEAPNDAEVEQALSGLTETEAAPAPGQRASGTRQDPRPAPAAKPQASPRTVDRGAAEGADPQAGVDEEAAWTMEQLRRNLTNIDRDA